MITLRAVLVTFFGLSCVNYLAAMENVQPQVMQSINDVPEYYANLWAQFKNNIVDDVHDRKIMEILGKNFPRFYKNYSTQLDTYSQQELVNAYKSMIKSLRTNWLPLWDYRMHDESFYAEWSLFYKYGGLLERENELILALAKKFGFEQGVQLKCAPNAMYLQVKNDILDKFKSVFNFVNM